MEKKQYYCIENLKTLKCLVDFELLEVNIIVVLKWSLRSEELLNLEIWIIPWFIKMEVCQDYVIFLIFAIIIIN